MATKMITKGLIKTEKNKCITFYRSNLNVLHCDKPSKMCYMYMTRILYQPIRLQLFSVVSKANFLRTYNVSSSISTVIHTQSGIFKYLPQDICHHPNS